MFREFLDTFPLVKLPATVREDTYREIGEENDPLAFELIEKYLACFATTPDDDYTEYMACFRLPKTPVFEAVVFWKAGLLTYDYFLATYEVDTGKPLDILRIAGVVSEGDTVTQAIGNIREDYTIHIMQGKYQSSGVALPEATATKPAAYELTDEGKFVRLI